MRELKQIIFESRGSEIAEAALVLPLMFTILLGIYYFGRAYNVYATLNYAARDAARSGVAPTCATCGNGFQSSTNIAAVVQTDLQNALINPALLQPPNPLPAPASCANGSAVGSCTSTTGPNIYVCQNVALDTVADSALQSCGVWVGFIYPYQMVLPFTSLNMTQVNIRATAQMAQEY